MARRLRAAVIAASWSEGSVRELRGAPVRLDKRFAAEAWRDWPFVSLAASFIETERWSNMATTGLRGVTAQHERQVSFITRQLLDMLSPANFPWANPEIIERTIAAGGANLHRGWMYLLEDLEREWLCAPSGSAGQLGKGLA